MMSMLPNFKVGKIIDPMVDRYFILLSVYGC